MPSAIATPPPAAPPATPAPAPPAAPAPAPAPAAAPGGAEPDYFKEFDAKFAAAGTAPPEPKEPPKGGEPPPAKPPAAPELPKPGASRFDDPKLTAPELRKQLKQLEGELSTKSKTYGELEAKLRDAEARGKNTDALTQRMETLQKEMDAIRAENRALKFQGSDEWKKNFEKPYNDELAYAASVISKLTVYDENQQPVSRADFEKDFGRLFFMFQDDPSGAIEIANQRFGNASQKVITEIEQLSRLERNKNAALEEERKNWDQRNKDESGKRAEFDERVKAAEARVFKELSESVEDYHDKDPEDTEIANARTYGQQYYDHDPKTLQAAIEKNMHLKNMVMAFWPHKLQLTRLKAKVAELEADLAKARPAPPNPKRPGGTAAETEPEGDFEEGLRKHMEGVI